MSLYDIAVAKAICGSGGGGGASGQVAIVEDEMQASYNDLVGMVNSGVLPWTVYENAGRTLVLTLGGLTISDEFYYAIFNASELLDGTPTAYNMLVVAEDATSHLWVD